MFKIGITGGIGSGKTTVCKIFQTLGIPVYFADEEAKKLMQHDPEVVSGIRKLLGAKAYDATGNLDRDFIAGQVFSDPEKLSLLNSLVHPATIRDSNAWAARQKAPYVLKEAALMFESEAFHYVDKVIGVSSPVTLRLHRTMKRSGLSREEVKKRMDKQMEEEVKMRLCDFVIYNDEKQALIPQVLELHKRISDF